MVVNWGESSIAQSISWSGRKSVCSKCLNIWKLGNAGPLTLDENHMLNARFYILSKDKILFCAVTYCLVKIKVMDETSALSHVNCQEFVGEDFRELHLPAGRAKCGHDCTCSSIKRFLFLSTFLSFLSHFWPLERKYKMPFPSFSVFSFFFFSEEASDWLLFVLQHISFPCCLAML